MFGLNQQRCTVDEGLVEKAEELRQGAFDECKLKANALPAKRLIG